MNIKKQQENINNLLTLIKENPDLEILPMVDTDCVAGDEFGYWMAQWGKASIDEYWVEDERVYFKEHDYEDLLDIILCNKLSYEEYLVMSDKEGEILAKELVDKLDWKKAIIINIDAM